MESILGAFVAKAQELEWIGASTNFVSADDLFFIPVKAIADGTGMDIVVIKVRTTAAAHSARILFAAC